MRKTDIVIIGAGPYGLSIAAHLSAQGADFRIFGKPMAVWRDNMPPGMFLKSEAFASDLFDPKGELTLKNYCRENGRPYAHVGVPVSRELFCEYGVAFQQRFVPGLEDHQVTKVRREEAGFRLELESGEICWARRIVVAVGISHYAHLPQELTGLPPKLVHHSSQQQDLNDYKGKVVAVIGAGSSAVDMAAAVHQAGADTKLFSRRTKIWFHQPPEQLHFLKRMIRRIVKPRSGLGLGWRSKLACDLPLVFHSMPSRFRIRVTRGHLGPSASWTTRKLVEGNVEIRLEMNLQKASVRDGQVALEFINQVGQPETILVDRVVAGTGYRVDMNSLGFLDKEILANVRCEQGTPILSRTFESSVPGLYFVGVTAANSFGPLLRFAWGARFTAQTLVACLLRTRSRFDVTNIVRLGSLRRLLSEPTSRAA